MDDGYPELSLVGSWTAKSSGYQGDSHETVGVMGSGSNKATWTLDVTPGAWYEVAVTWPQRSNLTYRAPFVVSDGNVWIDNRPSHGDPFKALS